MPDAPVEPVAPKISRRRPPCLKTTRHVERELARLYHALRQGEVTPEVAGTGGRLLNWIIRAKEVGELADRLAALEQQAAEP